MNVHIHRHLLEQLGTLYGSGRLRGGNSPSVEAAIAEAMDDRADAARLGRVPRRRPARDSLVIDSVLEDPQDDAPVAISVRAHFGDGTWPATD